MGKVNTVVSDEVISRFHNTYGSFDTWKEMKEVYNIFYTREWMLKAAVEKKSQDLGVMTFALAEDLFKKIEAETFGGKQFKEVADIAQYTLLPKHIVKELVEHATLSALEDYYLLLNKETSKH